MAQNGNTITVRNALKEGDLFTKLSAIVMGIGNIAKGQIIKGILFLAMELSFILFMIQYGVDFLKGLITLGTNTQIEVFNEAKQIYEYQAGDNSMLFLLFGISTIFVILFFIIAWRAAIKSAYLAQQTKEKGKRVPAFIDDMAELLNTNVHKTLLFFPMICVIAFTILPLAFMISMAFTNYDRNHQVPGNLFDWVGLANFAQLFDSASGLSYAFWHVLGWTIVWAIFATFLNYIFGMILAIIINRDGTRGKGFWRFIFVLSIAVPQFVSLLVMRTLLQPNGGVNVFLRSIGLLGSTDSLPFWTDVTWARITIVIVNLWIGIPYTMLQVTGILKNIPKDLFESAKIDGANPFKMFSYITLPYMLFVTAPYLITSFIGNINNFNVIYLLTGGAPASLAYHNGTAGKTDLLVTWLYKLTIDLKDYNFGAVIGIMVFVLSAVFALVTYRRTNAYKNEEGFQ